jgi:hypothetical protein
VDVIALRFLAGLFVVAGYDRAFLAITDNRDTVARHALRDQEVAIHVGAPEAQSEVIFLGASVIAVAGNRNFDLRVFDEPSACFARVACESGRNLADSKSKYAASPIVAQRSQSEPGTISIPGG